jgi:hypothetical protein
MSRLCRWGQLVRFSLLVLGITGVGTSPTAEAGVIPWVYDSMFGPVGSIQARSVSYTPYSAGYSGYYDYSTYYGGPYAAGYVAGAGCSSCQPACGCAPCYGGCASGNCATGNCASGNCASGNCGTGNCATTTNLAPGGTISPTPDPANSSRSVETRLEAIERELKINPPRSRTYEPDRFNTVPSRGRETIPNRPRGGTTDEFETPIPGGTGTGAGTGGTDDGEMFRENPRRGSGSTESLRIPIPGDTPETVIPSKAPAPASVDEKGSKVDEPAPRPEDKTTLLPLDTRVTSRAVSPRERQAITVGFAKPVVANRKAAPKMQVDAHPQVTNVARH